MLKLIQAARVPLNEYEFPASKLANVQAQLERLVEKNYYLHQVPLLTVPFTKFISMPRFPPCWLAALHCGVSQHTKPAHPWESWTPSIR